MSFVPQNDALSTFFCSIIIARILCFSLTKSGHSWKIPQQVLQRLTLHCRHSITIFFVRSFESVAQVCSWHLAWFSVSESTGQWCLYLSCLEEKWSNWFERVLSVKQTLLFLYGMTSEIWSSFLGRNREMIGRCWMISSIVFIFGFSDSWFCLWVQFQKKIFGLE